MIDLDQKGVREHFRLNHLANLGYEDGCVIEKLLELANGRLVIPLIVLVAGVALVKGAFHLTRSRSQDRKDFLRQKGVREHFRLKCLALEVFAEKIL